MAPGRPVANEELTNSADEDFTTISPYVAVVDFERQVMRIRTVSFGSLKRKSHILLRLEFWDLHIRARCKNGTTWID